MAKIYVSAVRNYMNQATVLTNLTVMGPSVEANRHVKGKDGSAHTMTA